MNASKGSPFLSEFADRAIVDSPNDHAPQRQSRLRASNYIPPRHPIETGRYFLLTPMIFSCLNHVLDCIEYRGTGFPIIGPQRIGKTRSIGATRRVLRSARPSLPVVTLIAEHTTVPSKREFFTGLLRQLRYVFYSSSSANALSSTLSDLLIQSANEKHSDCILVFIDNAHELKEPQYHWLCDVFNKLDESDITLITLLVGELHLDNSRTAFQKGEHRQISGRFFNDSFRFHGITSRDDVCACLSAYDGTRFPMNGGPTFTEEYFCEAFATAGVSRI